MKHAASTTASPSMNNLKAVFELGMVWKKEKDEKNRAKRALQLAKANLAVIEPFAAIMANEFELLRRTGESLCNGRTPSAPMVRVHECFAHRSRIYSTTRLIVVGVSISLI